MAISAAKWNMVSTSFAMCRQNAASRTSPQTTSSPGELFPSSHPQLLNELYWLNALTLTPCASKRSTRCEPIKPSAPVTSACLISLAIFSYCFLSTYVYASLSAVIYFKTMRLPERFSIVSVDISPYGIPSSRNGA